MLFCRSVFEIDNCPAFQAGARERLQSLRGKNDFQLNFFPCNAIQLMLNFAKGEGRRGRAAASLPPLPRCRWATGPRASRATSTRKTAPPTARNPSYPRPGTVAPRIGRYSRSMPGYCGIDSILFRVLIGPTVTLTCYHWIVKGVLIVHCSACIYSLQLKL